MIARIVLLFLFIPSLAIAQDKAKTEIVPTVFHTSVIDEIAYSPDGRWIAMASWDGSIKLRPFG